MGFVVVGCGVGTAVEGMAVLGTIVGLSVGVSVVSVVRVSVELFVKY